jgi:hypothetical protein
VLKPPNGTAAPPPPPTAEALREFLVTVRRGLLMIVACVDRFYPRSQPPERCPRCDWRWRD